WRGGVVFPHNTEAGAGSGRAAGGARALTDARAAGLPPLTSGGRPEPSLSAATPSSPMILTPRVPSSAIRWPMAELVSVTAERSSITGRPTKKPLDPRSHVSSSSSQSAIGGSAARAQTPYTPPPPPHPPPSPPPP